MNFEDEDFTKYKKKSKSKPPKKAKHKHDFRPCVFEYDGIRFDRAHGFVPDPKTSIDCYCTICGKIGGDMQDDYEQWIQTESNAWHLEYTEAGKKELDEYTRTLPTFRIDDRFHQKFVNIESEIL